MSGIFSDKSSIILRQLVAHPGRKWVIRNFTEGEWHLGQGWVQKVFNQLHDRHYALWHRQGRNSYLEIRSIEKLLEDWSRFYTYRKNDVHVYFSEDRSIEKKMISYFQSTLKKNEFILSLFSASRIHRPTWITNNVAFYLDPFNFESILRDVIIRLKLRKLESGGNVWLMKPYYKRSILTDCQIIKRKPVTSDLQLYLDFSHLPGRGVEQADTYYQAILRKWRDHHAEKT